MAILVPCATRTGQTVQHHHDGRRRRNIDQQDCRATCAVQCCDFINARAHSAHRVAHSHCTEGSGKGEVHCATSVFRGQDHLSILTVGATGRVHFCKQFKVAGRFYVYRVEEGAPDGVGEGQWIGPWDQEWQKCAVRRALNHQSVRG